MSNTTPTKTPHDDRKNPTSHTPGPWRVQVARKGDVRMPTPALNESILVEAETSQGFRPVAVIGLPDLAHVQANARLIAAAPDLLDALAIAFLTIENQCDPSNVAIPVIQAAMAKVDGLPRGNPSVISANKRLIAAAPELLAALEDIMGRFTCGANDVEAVEAAEAAIAKARGGA